MRPKKYLISSAACTELSFMKNTILQCFGLEGGLEMGIFWGFHTHFNGLYGLLHLHVWELLQKHSLAKQITSRRKIVNIWGDQPISK